MRIVTIVLSALLLGSLAAAAPAQDPTHETVLFRSGEGGYHTYRIPAIVATTKGTLLAFCEGRKENGRDAGDIDLVLRRSSDNGETWEPMQVVVDDGTATCGNPCPIIDRASGDIVLLITKNAGDDVESKIMNGTAPPRMAWVLRSEDDGVTWSAPNALGDSVRKSDYRWYATGPGHGIQLKGGRMIAPCDHSTGPTPDDVHSHIIYSDDAGRSWALGGELAGRTDESIAVELDDGALYLNARNNDGPKQRAYSMSHDLGLSFGSVQHDPVLIEPTCQGSVLGLGAGQVLFSNPASLKRENMTVRLSKDNAKNWPLAKVLWPGPAAYSDLALTADSQIACLYERGEKSPYDAIALARFSAKSLVETAAK